MSSLPLRKTTQIKILAGRKGPRVACEGLPSGLPRSGKAGRRKTKAGSSQGEYISIFSKAHFLRNIFARTEWPLAHSFARIVAMILSRPTQAKQKAARWCMPCMFGIKLENNDAERARCIAANNTSTQQHC